LTATVIPLELAFEHRNYFASLGICLAVADLLLFALDESRRRIGALLGALWLSWLAMTTYLRADEWSDPLRFASSEAAKHPNSPRAGYGYGRLLVIASNYEPNSPTLPLAMRELERDRAIPNCGILPHSALLLTAARTGQAQHADWWNQLIEYLYRHPLGAQETSAIGSLAQCARDRACAFAPDTMLSMFRAASSHGPNAEVFNIKADYVFNVLGQPDAALQLWQRAIAMHPNEVQYRINRIKVLIALGRDREAREAIAQLRQIGLFSANEQSARELEARMERPAAK
jgi:tetratricopeptide (TPR) repeat protein